MSKKKIAFIIFGVAFGVAIVSVLVNTFAFYLPAKRKNEENQRKLQAYYQSKIEQFEQENQSLSNVDIVFLGDSLTEGYDVFAAYSEYTVANRGISGDTTFGLEGRLDVSAYAVNPKVVCVLIGGNNLHSMMQNYESIVQKLKDNLLGSNIILLSLTAMGKSFAGKNSTIIQNNQEVKSIAQEYGCTYIDLFTPLYDHKTGQIKNEYTVDGAHLTAEGYSVLTSLIKPVVTDIIG